MNDLSSILSELVHNQIVLVTYVNINEYNLIIDRADQPAEWRTGKDLIKVLPLLSTSKSL